MGIFQKSTVTVSPLILYYLMKQRTWNDLDFLKGCLDYTKKEKCIHK